MKEHDQLLLLFSLPQLEKRFQQGFDRVLSWNFPSADCLNPYMACDNAILEAYRCVGQLDKLSGRKQNNNDNRAVHERKEAATDLRHPQPPVNRIRLFKRATTTWIICALTRDQWSLVAYSSAAGVIQTFFKQIIHWRSEQSATVALFGGHTQSNTHHRQALV